MINSQWRLLLCFPVTAVFCGCPVTAFAVEVGDSVAEAGDSTRKVIENNFGMRFRTIPLPNRDKPLYLQETELSFEPGSASFATRHLTVSGFP